MNRNPQLLVIEGALEGQSFEVTPEGLDIGRDATCDVCLPDPGVSRSHARVFLHNSAVWVQDNGSRNGAFVNGKRLQRPKTLSPGAQLKVGDHIFEVRLAADAPPPPPPAEPSVVTEGPTEVTESPPPAPEAPTSTEPTVAIEVPSGGGGATRAIVVVVLLLVVAGIAVGLLSG